MVHNFLRTLLFICALIFLPSCKRPYETFKRPVPVKAAHEKQRIVRKISKEQLAKPIRDMTLEEALKAKEYYEELGREDLVMRLIPHILTLSKDVHQNATLELEYADRNLSAGEIEKAKKLYTKFIANYPGDVHIKTARYHQILATFWLALEPDRDQAFTLEASEYAKSYIKDFPQDTEYIDKIYEILKECYLALMEGELGLVMFYCNKLRYEHKASPAEAARLRLNHIKETYLPLLAAYDDRVHTILETLEPIEMVPDLDYTKALDLAERISLQVAQLERLLMSPQQQHRIHPRDIF